MSFLAYSGGATVPGFENHAGTSTPEYNRMFPHGSNAPVRTMTFAFEAISVRIE